MAVADAYDALTSRRVYKSAMEPEVAKSIVKEESGAHFDPEIVAAFLAIEEQFMEIRSRFAEAAVAA